MTTMINRRRLQFGLRGLLVGMTVLGALLGWIGYNLNWIRQRHQFGDRDASIWRFPGRPYSAPGSLWLFGERPLARGDWLELDTPDDMDALRRKLDRLFPEGWLLKENGADGISHMHESVFWDEFADTAN